MMRGRRVGVIGNAMDMLPAGERTARLEAEFDALEGLGLDASEIDLRTVGEPRAAFDGLDALWVRGGNTFVLRYALAASRTDEVITRLVLDDSIVYAGYSAGVCVLAPNLNGLEQCDPVADVARANGADAQARFDGLGVLSYTVVPHIDSPDHPECDVLERVAAAYRRDGTQHRTLRDGEALVVDGDRTYVVGAD